MSSVSRFLIRLNRFGLFLFSIASPLNGQLAVAACFGLIFIRYTQDSTVLTTHLRCDFMCSLFIRMWAVSTVVNTTTTTTTTNLIAFYARSGLSECTRDHLELETLKQVLTLIALITICGRNGRTLTHALLTALSTQHSSPHTRHIQNKTTYFYVIFVCTHFMVSISLSTKVNTQHSESDKKGKKSSSSSDDKRRKQHRLVGFVHAFGHLIYSFIFLLHYDKRIPFEARNEKNQQTNKTRNENEKESN